MTFSSAPLAAVSADSPSEVHTFTSAPSTPPGPRGGSAADAVGSNVVPLSSSCVAAAFIQKLPTHQLAASGYASCAGTVLLIRVTQWIDRCTFEFPPGNCITWQAYYAFTSCTKYGPGTLWCPATGSWIVTPPAGRYKTRQHSEVQGTDGGYGDDWYETASVVIP